MIDKITLTEKLEMLNKRRSELERAISEFQNRLTALAQERIAVIGQVQLINELIAELDKPNNKKIKQKIKEE